MHAPGKRCGFCGRVELGGCVKKVFDMKITIDLRSAMIGLIAGVVLMFTLGASIGSNVGTGAQYQVAGTATHAVILNTQTGQAWTALLSSQSMDAGFREPKHR